MALIKVWLVLLLLASVASNNPVMRYGFCPQLDIECAPTLLASNSSFKFGDLTSGVYFYDDTATDKLSVSCSFHEPLHWVLSARQVVQVISIVNNITKTSSSVVFYYQIVFPEPGYGQIRCESYNDSSLAAEIYIARRAEYQNPSFRWKSYELIDFIPTLPDGGGEMVVRCPMVSFDINVDLASVQLRRISPAYIIETNITRKCMSCFPQPLNSTTSSPYGISLKMWTDAGKLLAMYKTASPWLDCLRTPECAFQTLKRAPNLKVFDCNSDREITCSDHFSMVSSYPRRCKKGPKLKENFREIESCLIHKYGRLFEPTEVDYDPRVGFRIKNRRHLGGVYECSYGSEKRILFIREISAKVGIQLETAVDYSSGTRKSIFSIVQNSSWRDVDLTMLPCFTLFDCEVQLTANKETSSLRHYNDIVMGTSVPTVSGSLFGKFIKNPPTSGVVRLYKTFRLEPGYVWDLQYYFTGLDSKSYFVSDSLPVEAVISLTKLDMTVKRTKFFEAQYFNGTISKVDQNDDIQWQSMDDSEESPSPSKRLAKSVSFDDSVVSIRCRAPFRNSNKQAEAVLLVQPEQHSTRNLWKALITFGSLVVAVGSITLAVLVIKKYRKNRNLRPLKSTELDEFWNGNTLLPTRVNNYVNVDSLRFPDCLQISPCDLKLDVHEIIGEGVFSCCVVGDLLGQKVAVKTIKNSVGVKVFKYNLREMKILAHLGKHGNIVDFLGAVVNELRSCVCFTVFELSPYGNLLSFLHQNNQEGRSNVLTYENVLPSGELFGNNDNMKLEIHHLSYFCEQIAAGMEFIVEKGVLHGELAARNVLVFPNYHVKLTGFGPSLQPFVDSNFKKNSIISSQWRWMAIESLKCIELSHLSEMWAYGVVVWEIYTFGQVPYAEIGFSREFVDKLDEGLRLERPVHASEKIYDFMKQSWAKALDRPSFDVAKIFFRSLSFEFPVIAVPVPTSSNRGLENETNAFNQD